MDIQLPKSEAERKRLLYPCKLSLSFTESREAYSAMRLQNSALIDLGLAMREALELSGKEVREYPLIINVGVV